MSENFLGVGLNLGLPTGFALKIPAKIRGEKLSFTPAVFLGEYEFGRECLEYLDEPETTRSYSPRMGWTVSETNCKEREDPRIMWGGELGLRYRLTPSISAGILVSKGFLAGDKDDYQDSFHSEKFVIEYSSGSNKGHWSWYLALGQMTEKILTPGLFTFDPQEEETSTFVVEFGLNCFFGL